MNDKEQSIPDKDEDKSKTSRRTFLKKGTQAALGVLLSQAVPAKEKLPEVAMQSFATIAYGIEKTPANYRKECNMVSDTGACDGTESSKPFETKDFVITAYALDNPENPKNPILNIRKKGDAIEITIYTWKGTEQAKSTLKKDDKNTPGLLWLLRALGKVEKK